MKNVGLFTAVFVLACGFAAGPALSETPPVIDEPAPMPMPAPPAAPMQTENVSQAMIYLEQDIQAQIKTFQKSIQIFHYFNAPIDYSGGSNPTDKKIHPSLNNKVSRDRWVNFLIGTRTGVFWDLNNHNMDYVNAGPGMYLAIDPDSSKEFGDTALILTVPEGTAFISVLKPFPLRKETLEALVGEGIISKAQLIAGPNTLGLNTGFTRYTLKNMLHAENNDFRALLSEIFSRNKISFIEYEYKSHLAGFCKVSSQSAFVFIGAKPEALGLENKVMGKVEEAYRNSPLFSSYAIEDLTDSERRLHDVTARFKDVLAQIRIKGTGSAAKSLILNNLSETEINELADKSYLCTRRY